MEAKYILRINVMSVTQDYLKNYIAENIQSNNKILLSYTTINSVNIAYNNNIKDLFNHFDIIHPDGIGIYLASKFIYGKNGFKNRFTGSDFYPLLIEEGIKRNWKFFLFGDTLETLLKAVEKNKTLNICGYENGYNFDDDDVIKKINYSAPDILVVGLGCPKQEEWIVKFKDTLNAKIILAVGDGIKIFAGTKKRGFNIFRILGLEWFIRLINNPKKYWKRYLIGIPLFSYRVIKYKLSNSL